MKAGFRMKDVLELVRWNKDHAQDCSYDELFYPKYYPGGALVKTSNDWPDKSKMLMSALPRCLHLVKDRGLYLMAGTTERMPAKAGSNDKVHVVYAFGCNPDVDEDHYDLCRRIFGRDDGATSIPIAWVDMVLKREPDEDVFYLDITPNHISLPQSARPYLPNNSKGPSL